jgi:quinone-reactive Ni/Fe-hydrogenase small subunit
MALMGREGQNDLYTAPFNRVDTNREEFYKELLEKSKKRVAELKKSSPQVDVDIHRVLESEGIDRRDFMKWVSAITATLMLPSFFEPVVAEAAELFNRVPIIWMEYQDCAGNTEALLRAQGPTVDEILLDVISLEFHDVLMAPSGHQAEKQLHEAAEHFKGEYLLFVEGSIPMAENGIYGTMGPYGETFVDNIHKLSKDAKAVVAVGNCATYGGVPAASPNPTGAVGVWDIVKGKPVINIPACPAHPQNMVGVLLYYIMTGGLPEMDSLLRPKFAFGYRIHDNCERRAHFDAGEFVEDWGDIGAQHNWCLYKMGCKGPMTFNNCSIIRYNDNVNWPIGSGHGCIGCAEPDFWDKYAYERPMAGARIKTPNGGVERSVDEFGLGLLAAAAVGIGAHAIASAVAGKKDEEA